MRTILPRGVGALLTVLAPLTGWCGMGWCGAAHAQDINIDIDDPAAAAGAGVPASSLGGAGNLGAWFGVAPTGAGPFALRNINNLTTVVTMSRTFTAAPGAFSANNPSTSGEHEKLLDDAMSFTNGQTVTHTVAGLTPGTYRVIVYAIAPDSATFRTSISVPGAAEGAQSVGGTMPLNAFTAGVTHSVHNITIHEDEALVIHATASVGFGTISGIQIDQLQPHRIYVVASGALPGWPVAYSSLQSALDYAQAHPEVRAIWMTGGTFRPTLRRDAADARSASFSLLPNLSLLGGFAGNESSLSQRGNPAARRTTLSGDLGVVGDPADNAYNVVFANAPNTALDGVTISGANNTHNDCATSGCFQALGGGMRVLLGPCVIRNCLFSQNRGSSTIASFGGGLLAQAPTTVINTTFLANTARFGAGVSGEDITLVNVAFLGNSAQLAGGGLHSDGTSRLVNAVFSGNTAGDEPTIQGGAAIANGGTLTAQWCTFANNGGDPNAHVIATNPFSGGSVSMLNSIIWGNQTPAIFGSATVTYSNVEGGFTGAGNLTNDPRFEDADGVDNAPGTIDDLLTLRPHSPCIDSGTTVGTFADIVDLDVDANTSEPIPFDLAMRPRQRDDPGVANVGVGFLRYLDRGAYEFQEVSCSADLDDGSGLGQPDGGVTVDDLVFFLGAFSAGAADADLDDGSGTGTPDGGVTIDDLVYFVTRFEGGC
jgi:hypothetical protein